MLPGHDAVPLSRDFGKQIARAFRKVPGLLASAGILGTSGGSLSGAINEARATVVSHATTADIWGAAGNQIDFTGSATVTDVPDAPQAGAVRWLTCDAGITFTNNANIAVQGGKDYLTEAGDLVRFEALTTTTFLVSVFKADGRAITEPVSSVLQVVYADLATSSTTTATIPLDDTIPQITEGVEVLTCSITPQSASSYLLVVANWNLCENSNTTDGTVLAALFRDSTADAICAQAFGAGGTSAGVYGALDNASCVMQKRVASGSTAATTFSLRLGGESAGTYRWNGASSSRRLGGAMTISITIYELL